ncbi:MAG: hypothetical protein IJ030_02725 [Oscillospiraceae bacterium]|nr:hypothetical protein [Oscillospiraceae bacterium]
MNKTETAKIISILQINYPDNFRGKSEAAIEATVNLWARAFADDAYAVVSTAVMSHIVSDTNRFMPPVGIIKAKIAEMLKPNEMTEQEAWGLVAKALRNSTYGADEEYAKLPPAVQRAVGGASQLRDWAMMDTETVQSVVASNFQRSYRVTSQRERDWGKLPSGVKQFIGELTEHSFGSLDAPMVNSDKASEGLITSDRL